MAISSKYFTFNKQRLSGLKGKPYVSGPTYNQFDVYDSCALTTVLYTVYTAPEDTELLLTTEVFIDPDLTTVASTGFYYYNVALGSPAGYIIMGGSIFSITQCTNNWIGLDQCGGSATTVYTRYADTALIVGVQLFTDPELSDLLVNSFFTYDGYRYSTNIDGSITVIFTCLTLYNSYDACGGNPLTLYGTTFNGGDKMYLDTNGDTQFTGSQFAYNGILYTYDNTGISGITGSSACPT